MNTSMIKASIKKELWEFKGMLLWVPIALMVLMTLVPLLGFLLNELNGDTFLDSMKGLAALEGSKLQGLFFASTMAVFSPFLLIGFIVQCYYLVNCLFDEKRDRSVMFWRSLPVSDGLTVAVKLFTGALVIPSIFMSAATALFLLGLIVNLIIATVLYLGYDISLFGVFAEAGLLSSLSYAWVSLVPTAIWLLPLFSWLMLASIFANKAPFLWAVLPIVALLIVEVIVVNFLQLSQPFFRHFISDYFSLTSNGLAGNESLMQPYKAFKMLLSQIDYRTFVVSGVLIYATYWFRVNKSEI